MGQSTRVNLRTARAQLVSERNLPNQISIHRPLYQSDNADGDDGDDSVHED